MIKLIDMAEQIRIKINKEFDAQVHVLSAKFFSDPIAIAKQITLMSAIRDAFFKNAEEIIKSLSLSAQGHLLQLDNLLEHCVAVYEACATEPEEVMTDFLQRAIEHVEFQYVSRKVS